MNNSKTEETYTGNSRQNRNFITSLRQYGTEFCESISIQGLAYLVKNISLLERLWWILVFTAGVSGSCFMVSRLLDKWITTPILVSLATQESKISDIPFPAVTICPESKISLECLNYTKILRERKKGDIFDSELEENLYFDLMSAFCKEENHNGTDSIIQNLLQVSGETDEISIKDYSHFLSTCSAVSLDHALCKWMGKEMNCTDVMSPVITDEGLCYTFNMYDVRDIYSDLNTMDYFDEGNRIRDWDPEEGFHETILDLENTYPRRAFKSGVNNGFTAIFMTKKKDLNYACQDLALQGLRVSLHPPTRLPRPAQVFFSVGLDRLTIAGVIPSMSFTAKVVEAYEPHKRGCYFGRERKLKFFKYYSQSNCNLECWTNYTQSHCGCVNFYMPRDEEMEICNLKRRFCLKEARSE
ncbi:hypothetical protein WA026_001536 [Henosepilachna vigintioctopunctata]|uniref:Pickpocket protein 28-like n=1 Tax=Henosepilachna vigintioctopunctata TaxID=420089 RepID=A0AAW1UQ81_9CUCU